MRSYRIGKTLKIRWGILTGGKSEPLSGRDLRLEIATGSRFRRNVPFEADDSVAEFLFQGSEQRYVGAYTLTMWENRGKENQTVVDRCDAFCLVACSCEESAESADEPNLDVEMLELGTSNLETGVPGMSAYELFKRHNPDSALTEEEYAEAPVVEAARAAALADNPPKIVEVGGMAYWAFYDLETQQYVTSQYRADDGTIVQQVEGSVVSLDVKGGTMYACGELTSLTIASVENSTKPSIVRFTSGATATQFSFPEDFNITGWTKPEENKSYTICILFGAGNMTYDE